MLCQPAAFQWPCHALVPASTRCSANTPTHQGTTARRRASGNIFHSSILPRSERCMELDAADALLCGNDDGGRQHHYYIPTEPELSLCPLTRVLSTFTLLRDAQRVIPTSLTVQAGLALDGSSLHLAQTLSDPPVCRFVANARATTEVGRPGGAKDEGGQDVTD